jgi:hypothetical protein
MYHTAFIARVSALSVGIPVLGVAAEPNLSASRHAKNAHVP